MPTTTLPEILDHAIQNPGPLNLEVEEWHLDALHHEMGKRGWSYKDDVSFRAEGNLRGVRLRHEELNLEAELAQGSFMGRFTKLRIWAGDPPPPRHCRECGRDRYDY